MTIIIKLRYELLYFVQQVSNLWTQIKGIKMSINPLYKGFYDYGMTDMGFPPRPPLCHTNHHKH